MAWEGSDRAEWRGDEGEAEGKVHGRWRLLDYNELPLWMRQQEGCKYIRGSYRQEMPPLRAVASIFRWHNETLNVHTHLLGCAFFIALSLSTAANAGEVPSGIAMEWLPEGMWPNRKAERWPVQFYLMACVVSLFVSASCHTMACLPGGRISRVMWRLDYCGIALLIGSSFVPHIHFCFQCLRFWKCFYLTAIGSLSILVIFTSFHETFQSDAQRPLRACMFAALGLMGLIPGFHQLFFVWDGGMPAEVVRAFALEVPMAASYLLGAAIYATRFPERFAPGKFDTVHSHALFHCFVLLGAYWHYRSSLVLLRWRDQMGCDG